MRPRMSLFLAGGKMTRATFFWRRAAHPHLGNEEATVYDLDLHSTYLVVNKARDYNNSRYL